MQTLPPTPLNDLLIRLSRGEPVVAAHLNIYYHSGATYDETIVNIIESLVVQSDKLRERLMDCYSNRPVVFYTLGQDRTTNHE